MFPVTQPTLRFTPTKLIFQPNIYQNIKKIYRLLFIILILNNKFTNRYTDLDFDTARFW